MYDQLQVIDLYITKNIMQLQSPQYGAHDCCGPSPLDPHPGVAALRSLLRVGGAQTCNNIYSIMWLDEPLGLIYAQY